MTIEELYKSSYDHPILFYDGVCKLCNGFVQYVIQHDHKKIVKFCALQETGGLAISKYLNLSSDMNTAVGLYKGEVYSHSDVLRMIATVLGGKWLLIKPLYLFPKSMRDFVYNRVAQNRYKWFGKNESCMIPDPALLKRFIC